MNDDRLLIELDNMPASIAHGTLARAAAERIGTILWKLPSELENDDQRRICERAREILPMTDPWNQPSAQGSITVTCAAHPQPVGQLVWRQSPSTDELEIRPTRYRRGRNLSPLRVRVSNTLFAAETLPRPIDFDDLDHLIADLWDSLDLTASWDLGQDDRGEVYYVCLHCRRPVIVRAQATDPELVDLVRALDRAPELVSFTVQNLAHSLGIIRSHKGGRRG